MSLECTALMVTVSVGSDTFRHVTEVIYATWSVLYAGLSHLQHSEAPILHQSTGTFCSTCIFEAGV